MGVDAEAHSAALQCGGRTIGVLGCGLAVNYPPANAKLRPLIIEENGGAILTEYPMNSPPHAGHFPPRNTIIAGLSLAVVVVEAAEGSGALVTARAALEENRHVYAVPGDITRAKSRGSNALLRAGAIPLTHPGDLLMDLEQELKGIATRHDRLGIISEVLDEWAEAHAEFKNNPPRAPDHSSAPKEKKRNRFLTTPSAQGSSGAPAFPAHRG